MSNRIALISVYMNTVAYCKKAKLPLAKSSEYSYFDAEFNDTIFFATNKPLDQPARVLVENIDSFDMAKKIGAVTDDRVLVLNLASDTRAGGGVEWGARAQEEELFRKSNYHQVLDPASYPLASDQVIYSPLVHIIKDNKYNLLCNFLSVSCLAVAAIRNPKLVKQGAKVFYADSMDYAIMERKIDIIFKVAIKQKHQHIVLGALGCGAYNNPTEEVAKMFSKAVDKYRFYFRTIGFAVLSGHGNTNCEIFERFLLQ